MSLFFFFFFLFENLSIVVVVTLATASLAACLLFTSAEENEINSISQLNMLKLTFNSTVLKKKQINHHQKQSAPPLVLIVAVGWCKRDLGCFVTMWNWPWGGSWSVVGAPPPPNPPSVSDSRDPYCCHVSGIFMQRKEKYNGCHCPFVMSQKAPDPPPRPGYGTSL